MLFATWLIVEPHVVESLVISALPQSERDLPDAEMALLLNDIRNLATGNIVSQAADPALSEAAERYANLQTTSFAALVVACAGSGGGGHGARLAFDRPLPAGAPPRRRGECASS